MSKTTNPFAMLMGTETKKAIIEALDGAEIEYRELTLAESDSFTKRMVKDFGKDGSSATIDFDEATEIKYEKISTVLVNPAMSVADLKLMRGVKATKVINELTALIDGSETGTDAEGN